MKLRERNQIYPGDISIPVRHVSIGNSGGDVEHDDCTLALDTFDIKIFCFFGWKSWIK